MLQANFIMIYIIHKIMRILKHFSKRLLFYLKNNEFFFTIYNDGKFKA